MTLAATGQDGPIEGRAGKGQRLGAVARRYEILYRAAIHQVGLSASDWRTLLAAIDAHWTRTPMRHPQEPPFDLPAILHQAKASRDERALNAIGRIEAILAGWPVEATTTILETFDRLDLGHGTIDDLLADLGIEEGPAA